MSKNTQSNILTAGDFRAAAIQSIPDAAVIFVKLAQGFNSDAKPLDQAAVDRTRDMIQPSTGCEKRAISIACTDLGFKYL